MKGLHIDDKSIVFVFMERLCMKMLQIFWHYVIFHII